MTNHLLGRYCGPFPLQLFVLLVPFLGACASDVNAPSDLYGVWVIDRVEFEGLSPEKREVQQQQMGPFYNQMRLGFNSDGTALSSLYTAIAGGEADRGTYTVSGDSLQAEWAKGAEPVTYIIREISPTRLVLYEPEDRIVYFLQPRND